MAATLHSAAVEAVVTSPRDLAARERVAVIAGGEIWREVA